MLRRAIFHFSFFIFHLSSSELMTVATNDKSHRITTAAHRLESGLVCLAHGTQVPYLNGARRSSWTNGK